MLGKLIGGIVAMLFAGAGVGFFLFVGAIMGTAFGALSGLCVGWVFTDSMALLIGATGLDAEPYQLGAIFGFVGGFIRTTVSK